MNIGWLILIFRPKKKKKDDLTYIKLHGSSDKADSIVTPTWRKTFDNSNDDKWKFAGEILSKANHIRIIGYSLPITDSYLKYFLKWGAAQAQNLKSIDVICLDDEQHSVENRYRDFIHHKLNFYMKAEIKTTQSRRVIFWIWYKNLFIFLSPLRNQAQ